MREIDCETLKKIELNILKDVAAFCEKEGLRYYLCGGTLLGCIRHQGFIPWDDDIDIIMPRPDYMKFVKLYNDRESIYKVNSLETDPNWYSAFAEVEDTRTLKIYTGFNINNNHGVNIDIFPTDGSPDGIIQLARFICSFIDLNKIVEKRAMKYNVDQSKYIGCSTFPHYSYKECVTGKPFLRTVKRKFEDSYFCTPDNYDEYLSNLYGDYMKLPSKDKQVTHHDFIAYWRDSNEEINKY